MAWARGPLTLLQLLGGIGGFSLQANTPMLPYVVVPSMLGVDLNLGKKSVKSEESPIEVVQKTQNTIQSTGSGEI